MRLLNQKLLRGVEAECNSDYIMKKASEIPMQLYIDKLHGGFDAEFNIRMMESPYNNGVSLATSDGIEVRPSFTRVNEFGWNGFRYTMKKETEEEYTILVCRKQISECRNGRKVGYLIGITSEGKLLWQHLFGPCQGYKGSEAHAFKGTFYGLLKDLESLFPEIYDKWFEKPRLNGSIGVYWTCCDNLRMRVYLKKAVNEVQETYLRLALEDTISGAYWTLHLQGERFYELTPELLKDKRQDYLERKELLACVEPSEYKKREQISADWASLSVRVFHTSSYDALRQGEHFSLDKRYWAMLIAHCAPCMDSIRVVTDYQRYTLFSKELSGSPYCVDMELFKFLEHDIYGYRDILLQEEEEFMELFDWAPFEENWLKEGTDFLAIVCKQMDCCENGTRRALTMYQHFPEDLIITKETVKAAYEEGGIAAIWNDLHVKSLVKVSAPGSWEQQGFYKLTQWCKKYLK